MVLWITGLSGAGKTTLAQRVVELARPRLPGLVLLDGDQVRQALGQVGHGLEGRWLNAQRICGLCRLLDRQGLQVVCAILSMFEESRRWNRANYSSYYEVFIDTPLPELMARDPKGLYRRAQAGQLDQVAGLDLPFTPPEHPDLVIDNQGGLEELLAHAPALAEMLVQAAARP